MMLKKIPAPIYRIVMFFKYVWRTDDQCGYFDIKFAWEMAGILAVGGLTTCINMLYHVTHE